MVARNITVKMFYFYNSSSKKSGRESVVPKHKQGKQKKLEVIGTKLS